MTKDGYRRFGHRRCDIFQYILGMEKMETAKNGCYCQSKGFEKAHESFYLLSREPNGPCVVRLSAAHVARCKTEEDAVNKT